MKVMILTADSNGGYTVPAVRGGAVSTLIEHLVTCNNEKQLCDMEIVSLYDANAEKKARREYPNIKFTWVKVPGLLRLLDKCAFNLIRIMRKNEKAISFRSSFSLIYYILKAKKIVNQTDADKIVIENNVPLARVMKGSKFKGEWYYHLHNVPRIDAGCRDEFQRVTKFLCVSQFVANQITAENSAIGRIDPKKTAVLYNCVDTQLFRPVAGDDTEVKHLREKYSIRENDLLIVFTGRLSEEKGPDKVLEAMNGLPDRVKCLIVGSLMYNFDANTPFHDKLRTLASQLKDRVFFTGYIQHNDLPFIYNMADVAVLPSMWDEPAGLTNLEAMACGLTVITTRAGGIPEYVGENGIVLERDSQLVQNIRTHIMSILAEKHILKGNTGEFTEKFGTIRYYENFIDLVMR